ncbi:EAL domain-containing protein [Oxalicibacterium faecigallinarum]|uniref:Diguanylate phosphodiesterase n=1 Tax=Oxalicibacterium faecigallinarum TaxID=573741 RepID=A0A8J3B055_9BURK|nr:EAL domain-containing protein [Oxalicibacterium faecigallinarum]GGI21239.1 diguanylate phosphodiesterase [Oxalicibacterium faecigallinarum]
MLNSTTFFPADIKTGCAGCSESVKLPFSFSYAYQPIVNIASRSVYAHEALVRGPNGESAYSVLEQVTDANRYRFDQACRIKAIKTAAALQMPSMLSINFLPNAIYQPELCIRSTLEAARTHDFPINRLIFEAVEGERVEDGLRLTEILREYQRIGFLTAIDDFGAGFAGLNLLANFQPDIVKLDMDLVRRIDQSPARQSIARAVIRMLDEMKIVMIAEGVETQEEAKCLAQMGVRLMQGYLFSRPLFEACGNADEIMWPHT